MKPGNFLIILSSILFAACGGTNTETQQESWGEFEGKAVYLYTLANENKMEVKVCNYGAIISSVLVPDRKGNLEDVVLGFDNLEQYLEPNPCFGAAIGRFANRIKDGRFSIGDSVYQLSQNDNGHCIHGGNEFDRVVWESEIIKNEMGNAIRLHHFSKDGSNGFPGNLDVYVTYTLTADNSIHILFEATTDKSTHVNLTQHSYFNLAGTDAKIFDQQIRIDADNYTEIDEDVVPTGIISTVKGKDWDLTELTRIGDNIHKLDKGGYHYCYVFNKEEGEEKMIIEVLEPESGRFLEVTTSQPGVQFYTGNGISNLSGKGGVEYGAHSAFCLETQHFPDSPNHLNFPSTLLNPGEKYQETVIYHFGVR